MTQVSFVDSYQKRKREDEIACGKLLDNNKNPERNAKKDEPNHGG